MLCSSCKKTIKSKTVKHRRYPELCLVCNHKAEKEIRNKTASYSLKQVEFKKKIEDKNILFDWLKG